VFVVVRIVVGLVLTVAAFALSITIMRTFRSNPLVRSVNKFALRSGFVN
jgi:hypothetical protein